MPPHFAEISTRKTRGWIRCATTLGLAAASFSGARALGGSFACFDKNQSSAFVIHGHPKPGSDRPIEISVFDLDAHGKVANAFKSFIPDRQGPAQLQFTLDATKCLQHNDNLGSFYICRNDALPNAIQLESPSRTGLIDPEQFEISIWLSLPVWAMRDSDPLPLGIGIELFSGEQPPEPVANVDLQFHHEDAGVKCYGLGS